MERKIEETWLVVLGCSVGYKVHLDPVFVVSYLNELIILKFRFFPEMPHLSILVSMYRSECYCSSSSSTNRLNCVDLAIEGHKVHRLNYYNQYVLYLNFLAE